MLSASSCLKRLHFSKILYSRIGPAKLSLIRELLVPQLLDRIPGRLCSRGKRRGTQTANTVVNSTRFRKKSASYKAIPGSFFIYISKEERLILQL